MLKKIFGMVTGIKPNQLPLIDAESKGLKRVYWLTEELNNDPKHVELVRALTLNKDKPLMGLKGTHGLFASSEWWNNINKGIMPLLFVSGKIVRVYEAGQDQSGVANTVDIETADGKIESAGIYVNNEKDVALFKVGSHVEIVYVKDELKRKERDGAHSYSKSALEMAVSKSNEA